MEVEHVIIVKKDIFKSYDLTLDDDDEKEEEEEVPEIKFIPALPEKTLPPNTISIDDILLNPLRKTRPIRIVVIMRGIPGSGKTYLAKMIKEKEVEMGGSAPRIMSIDDYFMVEKEVTEICPETKKSVKIKKQIYEYEMEMEENYTQCLMKSYKKTITDGLFNFIIVDCINQTLRHFTEIYNFAKLNGFMVSFFFSLLQNSLLLFFFKIVIELKCSH